MTQKLLFGLFFLISLQLSAQLPDGAIAPDWTATDLNGNTHNLYDLLDQGKHVVLDFGATWCGPCWDYHQTGILEELYTLYGPNGTNELMVFLIEGDGGTNESCLYGPAGCNSGTYGNWVNGTDYPIINLTGSNLDIVDDYNINYWPTVYAINADHKTVWETGQISLSFWETILFESFELDANPNVIAGNCDDDGIIELNPTGGASNFLSYQWSNGSNDENPSNLPTGLYSVTCTDAIQYFETFDNIYVENDGTDLEIISEFTSDISCYAAQDGSIELIVSSSSSVSYIWDNGMSGNFIEDLPQGVYDVTIVNNSNNCEIYASYFVEEPEEIYLEVSENSASCDNANGTIDFYYEGGTAPYTVYLEGNMISQNPIPDLPEGNYLLEVQDGNNCLVSTIAYIGNIPGPSVQIENPDTLSCLVQTTLLDASNSSGSNLVYSWHDALGNSLGDQAQIEVNSAGVYYCALTDTNTDCTELDSVEIFADLAIASISIAMPEVIECAMQTIQLMAEVDAPVNASWYTNDGVIVQGVNTLSPEVSAAGMYYLQASRMDNGCVSMDSVMVLAIENDPEANFNYLLDNTSLEIEDLSIGTGLEYSWDFGDGNSSSDANPTHAYAENGIYEVCLMVTNVCGQNSICKTVFVGGAPGFSYALNDISCFGWTDGSIIVTPSSGVPDFQIAWQGTGGFTSNAFAIQNLSPGIYSMVLTDATGAFVESSFTLVEPSEIVLNSSTVVNDLNGGGTGSGTVGNVLANISEGSYTVEVLDENLCTASFSFEVGNEISSNTDELDRFLSFKVFPNPSSDFIQITYNLESLTKAKLQLIALDGRVLLTENLNSSDAQIRLNVKQINSGMYLLSLSSGSEQVVKRVSILK